MGAGGNFKPVLNLIPGGVAAEGPLDTSVKDVVELCVWVFQRNGDDDATANMMASPPTLKIVPRTSWKLDLRLMSKMDMGGEQMGAVVPLVTGPAFGVAIGLFIVDEGGTERQSALVWGEPVQLNGGSAGS